MIKRKNMIIQIGIITKIETSLPLKLK